MAIVELYSTRKKHAERPNNDVFQYDELPMNLRNQIVNIIQSIGEIFGYMEEDSSCAASSAIVKQLRHEHGVLKLVESYQFSRTTTELFTYIRYGTDADKVLDAVELSCRYLEQCYEDYRPESMAYLHDCIQELNYRFRENGVGYQYENHQIIRIDNTFIHAEAVKPALLLLSDPAYRAAEKEFLVAYEHFRNHNNKDAILNAGKALESTLKIICDKQGWKYEEKDTAKRLIEKCFKNELISSMMQSFWGGLRSILESGTPIIRNKVASHGEGSEYKDVPDYIVNYMLHMTASNIVMLINAEKEYSKK